MNQKDGWGGITRQRKCRGPNEFFTPYVGKHYTYPTSEQGAQLSFLDKGRSIVRNPYAREKDKYVTGSEITSMALEYAWAQPQYLAQNDPRLFDWVFETVMR